MRTWQLPLAWKIAEIGFIVSAAESTVSSDRVLRFKAADVHTRRLFCAWKLRVNAEPIQRIREAESNDEARVKLSTCVRNAVIQVRFSSYSSHVSAMAILFAYNALSYDRPTRSKGEREKIDGRGRMERDAHYANEQTMEDDDDEVSRWGRWPVFCANTRQLRKMIEVGDPDRRSSISIARY